MSLNKTSIPHSPDLEALARLPDMRSAVTSLFQTKSPVSMLAHELDCALTVQTPSFETKTPRRCLFSSYSSLKETPSDSLKAEPMVCDSPLEDVLGTLKKSRSRSTEFTSLKTSRSSTSLFGGLEKSASWTMLRSSPKTNKVVPADLAVSKKPEKGKNPFHDFHDLSSPPSSPIPGTSESVIMPKKSFPLKFKDQNLMKPPCPKSIFNLKASVPIAHWNNRTAQPKLSRAMSTTNSVVMSVRKRDFEFPTEDSEHGPSRKSIKTSKLSKAKIKRAMTFSGPSIASTDLKSVLHPPLADDLFSQPSSLIPSFHESGKDMIKRITIPTLVDIIDGKFRDKIDDYFLIDCRYPFEYNGGHIKTAKNITTVDEIENMFFKYPMNKKVVIVFHCEYSIQRAPQMALHFRSRDRNLNHLDYPNLYYPDIYVLQGGYRAFYAAEKNNCEPIGYVEMNDPRFAEECKEGMSLQRKQFRKCFSEGFLR